MKKNQDGIALIIVIFISALALILVSLMLWLVLGGTKISGMSSQYKSASDAAKGASSIVISMLKFDSPTPDLPTNDYSIANPTCMAIKLEKPTIAWSNWNCSNAKPDIIIQLGSYTVYATIILTQVILPQKNNAPVTYFYTVKVHAFSNQNESSNITFVYKISR
ncbi:hypothetical protein DESAMIL20_394 [Desulfurella amilsii]|uniref:Type IV fimbrial biogenesis protein PilX n=1 Tax=Desulfurella amilsii TaxID=1562698 RepID=A0A1X4XZ43_9BACT|nr:hypothetical protein [Desulfurella amilsii]OSS42788.1 hypothetical protein DESAMIL20_394 [Desulfurella amilsii]